MYIVRGKLGLGEAGNWSGAVKSNDEWFPVKEIAIAQGIFNSEASIGNVTAPFVIVFIYAEFGWKTTYIVLGVVGLFWVISWIFINKSTPEKHSWITQEERDLIHADRINKDIVPNDKNSKSISAVKILSYIQSWVVLLCCFFIEPIWWFFSGWMPIYLNKIFDLSIDQIDGAKWISYLMAAAGSLVGGWFSGFLMKTMSEDSARKTVISLGGLFVFIEFVYIIKFLGEDNFMTLIYLASLVLFGFQLVTFKHIKQFI